MSTLANPSPAAPTRHRVQLPVAGSVAAEPAAVVRIGFCPRCAHARGGALARVCTDVNCGLGANRICAEAA